MNLIANECKLMQMLIRNPKFWCILFIDILAICIALYISYVFRFENSLVIYHKNQYLNLLPLAIAVKSVCFYMFGLYRGMWRYTSTSDLLNIFKATITAAVIIVVVLLYFNRFAGLSRSVFVLDTLFTFLFVLGNRFLIRMFYGNKESTKMFFQNSHDSEKKRLLLVGAEDATEKVLREIKRPMSNYRAVCLVDDDLSKAGMKIHGVPVRGTTDDITALVERLNVDEILISISSISGAHLKKIVNICQLCSTPYKIIPTLGELLENDIPLKSIREINYKDLLGRNEVKLDLKNIERSLKNQIVFISGAGGSIGSELSRQLLKFEPKKIILFDSSEENLFKIQTELEFEFNANNIIPILGKIQDLSIINYVFRTHRPQVVLHAAAYKHVPMLEKNPWQAIDNNIFGSQLLIETSIIYEVKRFVLVSTDKAVRPTNVMGASKRFVELMINAYSSENWEGNFSRGWDKLQESHTLKTLIDNYRKNPIHKTTFVAVRFGNVLGSSGSVIPIFKRQIERGGPITVTHKDVTRFFMSVDEACQLILQAGCMSKSIGDLFILKMGKPVKILQMAEDLIRLDGKRPGIDINIEFTGLRPGEKLYEELITEGENIIDTTHQSIMVLKDSKKYNCVTIINIIEKLRESSNQYDSENIKSLLKNVICEYTPETTDRTEIFGNELKN